MKYIVALFIMGFILSCKKESPPVLPLPFGASNKMEGDIIWGGTTTTHFINQPATPSSIYADFELATLVPGLWNEITMTGSEKDTIITFCIQNPNLNTLGVYHFQDLDTNHYVSTSLQSGYGNANPPGVIYTGISYSNKGQLNIDTISENHISGSIDTYCNKGSFISNNSDTVEVHMIIHFSGDLHQY